jgi:hypothetical protein
MWKKLGKLIVKGVAWLISNPETLIEVVEGVKRVKDAKKNQPSDS